MRTLHKSAVEAHAWGRSESQRKLKVSPSKTLLQLHVAESCAEPFASTGCVFASEQGELCKSCWLQNDDEDVDVEFQVKVDAVILFLTTWSDGYLLDDGGCDGG